MSIETIINLYWSKDFLLNITAEFIGVAIEVILVTVILKKILDNKELTKWRAYFKTKIQRLLKNHKEMPSRIEKTEIVDGVDLKILVWAGFMEDDLKDAISSAPPKLNEPMYIATIDYFETLKHLEKEHMNKEMNISSLHAINRQAQQLANVADIDNKSDYVWDDSLFDKLESELKKSPYLNIKD